MFRGKNKLRERVTQRESLQGAQRCKSGEKAC